MVVQLRAELNNFSDWQKVRQQSDNDSEGRLFLKGVYVIKDSLLAHSSGGPVGTAHSAVAVGHSVSQVYEAVQTASHFPMTSPRSWSACALALLLTEQTQSMHQTYIQTNIKSMVMHQTHIETDKYGVKHT